MTTPHHIGELLRSGVLPTDEETEHLRVLGGFVAEMYGRFMGGHAEHLTSAADLWSGKLSSRLSAATGARWERGLGLAELLLSSELTSFWQIAREGLHAGYADFGAEMSQVDLYEEEGTPAPVEEVDEPLRRRRPSLFGARDKAATRARRAGPKEVGQTAERPTGPRSIGDLDLSLVALRSDEGAREGGKTRNARWSDGSFAEMAVIRALAEGGLFVGDQLSRPVDEAVARKSVASEPRVVAQADLAVAGGARVPDARRPATHGVRPVLLDGLRIDARTPALATALARAEAVFGRGVGAASQGVSVAQERLARLTASPEYSIDRGLGVGERPVYGFFDAVETTYLNLVDEVARADAVEGEVPAGVARVARPRAAAAMPASARGARLRAARFGGTASAVRDADVTERAAQPVASVRSEGAMASGARAVQAAPLPTSLDRVVAGRGGGVLRPFVVGVFASGGDRAVQAARQEPSRVLASEVSHAPSGEPIVRIQRGGMSAPRYSVVGVGGGTARVAAFVGGTGDGLGFGLGPDRAAGRSVTVAPFQRGGIVAAGAQAGQAGTETSGGAVLSDGGILRGTRGVSEARVAAPTAGRQFEPTPEQIRLGVGSATGIPAGPTAAFVGDAGDVSEQPLGFAARMVDSIGLVMGPASWRLAVDGGSDLPLGATFSRHEAFAGSRAAQGVADTRLMRSDFGPIVSGDRTGRPSELAQAMDGMVWVTLPSDAEPPSGIESLGLAAVPSRRATMVPAGVAFQSIASAVARRSVIGQGRVESARGEAFSAAESTASGATAGAAERRGLARLGAAAQSGLVQLDAAAQSALVQRGAAPGGLAQIGAAPAGPTQIGAAPAGPTQIGAPPAGPVQMGAASAGSVQMGAAASSGLVEAGAPTVGGAWDTVTLAGIGDVAGGVSGRGAGIASRMLDGAALALALRSGMIQGGTAAGTTPRIGSAESGLVAALAERGIEERSLAGRWVGAALASDGAERGLRAARFLEGVVGRGGYGRIESERELLAIVTDAPLPDAVEATSPVSRPRRPGVRSVLGPTFAPPSATTGVRARRDGRPVGTASGERADAVGGVADARVGAGTAPGARTGGAPDARFIEARTALLRSVVTARESRAVAELFADAGASPLRGADRGSMVQEILERGFARVGADEPVLGRLVHRMNVLRAEEPLAARWATPASIVERLAGLEGAERRAVARAFASSGWSQQELQMLRIESPEATAPDVDAGQVVAGGRVESRVGAVAAARAARMGRSLARIVTGTEGLGGAVNDKGAAASISKGQSAAWLPLLAAGGEAKYFGGLAPTVAARGANIASLREAVGDLVRMAEAAMVASDTPVALAARKEVLRRVQALEARGSEARPLAAMMKALADRVSGVSGAPDVARTTLADRIGERAEVADLVDLAQVEPMLSAERPVREMHIGDVEREMVGLERESTGLEARLAEALALSASGPAGARRMLRSVGKPIAITQPEPVRKSGRRGEPDEATQVRDTVMNGVSPEARPLVLGGEARHAAAVKEEARPGLAVTLGGVMAPEAMLAGLRSRELSEAIRTMSSRQATFGFDMVPVLTTLADAGVDLAAARSSIAAYMAGDKVIKRHAGDGMRSAEAFDLGGLGAEGFKQVESAMASQAPEQSFVELIGASEGIVSQVAGAGRRQRAGLLSAILRGTERAEMTALLEQAGGREFAMAWLNRVDGTRSGIDIGMKDTRSEFGRAFGARRESAAAGASPISGASFVDTSAPASVEDRSGLRNVAASVVNTATGAARPQHGASQAMRRTDWSFVDTGSRASTSHADLGKLASAIVGSAESGQRAPMPLVAPAAKAIAQTALRAAKTESNSSQSSTSNQSKTSQAGSKGPVDAKMSDKAIEMLAIEMANRVARLMGLKNERRGIWS